MTNLMEKLKNLANYTPGHINVDPKETHTSHLLNQRKRLSFTGIFLNEGFHMENEKMLNERRIKTRIFRHFNYFGPRGEIFFYTLLLLGVSRLIKNNLQREKIEENLNDNNTFLLLPLALENRTIHPQNNK